MKFALPVCAAAGIAIAAIAAAMCVSRAALIRNIRSGSPGRNEKDRARAVIPEPRGAPGGARVIQNKNARTDRLNGGGTHVERIAVVRSRAAQIVNTDRIGTHREQLRAITRCGEVAD